MITDSPLRSPQKRWIRNTLWDHFIERRIKKLNETYHGVSPRYFTFPGEFALDIKRYVKDRKYFKIENVHAYEHDHRICEKIRKAYPQLKIQPSKLEPWLLERSSPPEANFFFDVVNLDFEDRALMCTPDQYDKKLLTIEKIFWYQKRQQRSFSLFLTSNGSFDANATVTHRMIIRTLEDHAKRLGSHDGYFRLAQHGLEKIYHSHLMDCLTSAIIRIGYEAHFYTKCQKRVSYVPFSDIANRPQMICLIFEAEYSDAPLSQTSAYRWKYIEKNLEEDQISGLNTKIIYR